MHVPVQLIYKAQGNPFRLGRDKGEGNSQTQYMFKWSKLCLEGDGHVMFGFYVIILSEVDLVHSSQVF